MKLFTRDFLIKICLLTGCMLLISAAAGQVSAQKDVAINDADFANVMKTKGKIIAEGRNATPVGQYKLKTYRVEEISLPKSVAIERQGKLVNLDRAWRVTITGGPFPVRALPPVIWVGDVAVGNGVENEQLSEVSVLVFDRALLRDGAAIALSYGETKQNRDELPEKLRLTGTK